MPWAPKTHGAARREQERRLYAQSPERKAAQAFYHTAAWIRFRAAFIVTHPLCCDCEAIGLLVPTREVHHEIDVVERRDLAFDPDNCRGLCKPCHSRRTAMRMAVKHA